MKYNLYIILSIITISLFTSCSEKDFLFKYEEYPCKHKIFHHQSKVVLVQHGNSYMNKNLHYISSNTFENHEDFIKRVPQTDYKEIIVYQENTRFKVIGYYAGVTLPCWSRCTQGYLVKLVILIFFDSRILIYYQA